MKTFTISSTGLWGRVIWALWCSKEFRSTEQVEFHGMTVGHLDFTESTTGEDSDRLRFGL